MTKFNIILCYLTLFTISYGGTIDPKANDSEHLNYGNQHNCVVKIDGKTSNNEYYWASGVIIKPKWVVTAAHVIDNTKEQYIVYKTTKIKVISVFKPETFKQSFFGKNDIALCFLENPIELDYYPELYDNNDEVGKICSQAGFGSTGTFVSGSIITDGRKRGGSNIIDTIDRDMLVCSVLSGKKTSMEFLISHGDSGGGLFIDNKLAGIHSMIWNNDKSTPKATYSTKSGHTRVSIFKSWIEQTIKDYKTK